MPAADDVFTLYDLRVEVVATDRPMVCSHRPGDYFLLSGENLSFPDGQTFPLYPLAALLPILPAKQRMTDAADWITTDTDIDVIRQAAIRDGMRTLRLSGAQKVGAGYTTISEVLRVAPIVQE